MVQNSSAKAMTKNYNKPQILQGKVCRTKSEQASQKWYVEFYLDGKRIRLSKKLNKMKNYNEKLQAFTEYRDEVEQQLKAGTYGKAVPKPVIIPTMKDAIKAFVQHHVDKGSRPKTVQSYTSKLKYLCDHLGSISVNYVYHKDIDDLLILLTNQCGWSPKTHNNARLIYYGFFQFCIDSRWIETNPVSKVKTKYVAKSDRNKAFSKDDFARIMVEVEKDSMLTMFVKSAYYTCIRPRELMGLQVKHINFEKRTIFVPASISKNKKDGHVHIDDSYYQLLTEYYLNAPENSYLFCNDTVLWGTTPYQPNRPYKRFVKILERLKLNKKGYTLYSVKHYSNVQKFLSGWTVAEIMKANRHASIEETENYLRDLLDYVDITKKVVPSI